LPESDVTHIGIATISFTGDDHHYHHSLALTIVLVVVLPNESARITWLVLVAITVYYSFMTTRSGTAA
jgi:hypothetical protein